MGDTRKHSVSTISTASNDNNKIKKSKKDVRKKLGLYLKHKNYTVSKLNNYTYILL